MISNPSKTPLMLWIAISLVPWMSGCATPASAACIVYAQNRPTISESDTLETQLSIQNLDVAMYSACKY